MRFSFAYTLLILLGTLASCNQGPCDIGESTKCYRKDGVPIGFFCPASERVPCVCYDEFGTDLEKDWGKPCDPTLTGGEAVEEPYEFDCYVTAGTACVDHVTNDLSTAIYFDYTEGSNDSNYKPLYVKFGIHRYNPNYAYRVTVLDETTRRFVAAEPIALTNPNLRSFDVPSSCDGCYVTGTLKLDIKYLSEASKTPELRVQFNMHPDDPNSSYMTDGVVRNFNKRNTDHKYTGINQRKMHIKTIPTKNYDIRKLSTNNRTPLRYDEAVNQAMGAGSSNIRFTFENVESVPKSLVKQDNDAATLRADFYTNLDDIDPMEHARAENNWWERMYNYNYPEIDQLNDVKLINSVFSTIVDYYELADFQASSIDPPTVVESDVFLQLVKSARDPTIIIPAASTLCNQRFCGTVNFEFESLYLSLSAEARRNPTPTVGAIALAAWIHELGHAWSKQAMKQYVDVCSAHTDFCSGIDKDLCIWRACKTQLGEEFDRWAIQNSLKPRYCERHQYIFTQGLTINN